MIILGGIGVVLLIISFIALIGRESSESYAEAYVKSTKVVACIIGFFGACLLVAWYVVLLLFVTFEEPDRTPKPTILSCNGIVVAESINGFAYNSKGGAYEDYRNNLTYTPRQGEVCKEYLKGSE